MRPCAAKILCFSYLWQIEAILISEGLKPWKLVYKFVTDTVFWKKKMRLSKHLCKTFVLEFVMESSDTENHRLRPCVEPGDGPELRFSFKTRCKIMIRCGDQFHFEELSLRISWDLSFLFPLKNLNNQTIHSFAVISTRNGIRDSTWKRGRFRLS